MRYESFYPFARQQSQPTSMGQTGFGPRSQMRQQPPPIQPFMNDQMGNPFGNPMGNPSGGPMAGQGEQPVPSKMESYMQTANQFLNTAQQFAPVVQQFAPMVQNLPAMWRLYKGFQSLPVAGAANPPVSGGIAAAQSVANVSSGLSTPRIFQPPIQ